MSILKNFVVCALSVAAYAGTVCAQGQIFYIDSTVYQAIDPNYTSFNLVDVEQMPGGGLVVIGWAEKSVSSQYQRVGIRLHYSWPTSSSTPTLQCAEEFSTACTFVEYNGLHSIARTSESASGNGRNCTALPTNYAVVFNYSSCSYSTCTVNVNSLDSVALGLNSQLATVGFGNDPLFGTGGSSRAFYSSSCSSGGSGYTFLPLLSGQSAPIDSYAIDVSDGSSGLVIAGEIASNPVKWTGSGSTWTAAALPYPTTSGITYGGGRAVRTNQVGTVLVGLTGIPSSGNSRATRWNLAAGTTQDLWQIGGGTQNFSTATDVSTDYLYVVGYQENNSGGVESWIWSPATQVSSALAGWAPLNIVFAVGMTRNLMVGSQIVAAGFSGAYGGISTNGRFMSGTYSNTAGSDGSWIGRLPIACGPSDIGSSGGYPFPDGVLDNNDFIVFNDYLFSSDTLALEVGDIGITGGVPGQDGVIDNNDYVVFINNYYAGC